jgi:hypothetical protein
MKFINGSPLLFSSAQIFHLFICFQCKSAHLVCFNTNKTAAKPVLQNKGIHPIYPPKNGIVTRPVETG